MPSGIQRISLLLGGRQVVTVPVTVLPEFQVNKTDYVLPTGGQQGQRIVITGPCDGVFGPSDTIELGGVTLEEDVESSSMKAARNTVSTYGPTTLKSTEGGVTVSCPFRNLGITMSADRLNLIRGQTATLTTTVLGLLAVKEAVPLHLSNDKPAVIDLSGGNQQHHDIRPDEVRPDGTYVVIRTLTGRVAGSFGLTATVRWTQESATGVVRPGRPEWLRMHDNFTVAAEAYGNAAGRFSGAWQRGAATVGRNILKADEQAMRDREVAAGKLTASDRVFAEEVSKAAQRAQDEAQKKYRDSVDKAVRTHRAVIASMSPAERASVRQEGVAMVSAAAVWLNAQQRYADALVRR